MDRTSLLELIKRRRSVRRWKHNQDVEDNKLNMILEAGIWAPTGSNTQKMKYVIIRDRGKVEKIASMKRMSWPNLIIVVIYDLNKKAYLNVGSLSKEWGFLMWEDAGATMMNMLLMAEALGLSACWVSWAYPTDKEKIQNFLSLPQGLEVCASAFLGYSDVKIDLNVHQHQGCLVKRGPIADYIL